LAFAEQMFEARELSQSGSGQLSDGFDEKKSCADLAAIDESD
jgi:hypothetical protein